MKEVTEIYTVQVTMIGKCDDEYCDRLEQYGKSHEKQMAEWLKERWGADDVVATKQLFIRDLEGEEE